MSLPDLLDTTSAARILHLLMEEETAAMSGARPLSTALSKIGLVEKLLEVVKDPASLEQGKSYLALTAVKNLAPGSVTPMVRSHTFKSPG